jgi:GTP cyclohydrolase IA
MRKKTNGHEVNVEAEVAVSGKNVGGVFMSYDAIVARQMFVEAIAKHVYQILMDMEKWTGFRTSGPNFHETPLRVGKAYLEIFGGLFDHENVVKDILSKTFPAKADEMITVGPVEVWSMCPHHFLPVFMKVWVGYIPEKKVLGLSKLARLAELMAKRPALQEDTTIDIAKTLQQGLHPLGAACIIKGRHLCMEMRGVKKSTITTTTALEGVFRTKPEAKSEFLDAVRKE